MSDLFKELMREDIMCNKAGEPLIEGCNYHTTWQSNKRMRFVLDMVLDNGRVVLKTRNTKRRFSTNADDLIFIKTDHNCIKAKRLL